ncbi:MAG: TOBE domain-containing protein, partial [Candidatus Binatia bacterium]
LEGTFRRSAAQQWVELADGERIPARMDSTGSLTDGARVRLITRPEDIVILPPDRLEPTQIDAIVEQVDYLGDCFEYYLRTAGALLILTAPKKDRYAVGAKVRLGFDPARLSLYAQ